MKTQSNRVGKNGSRNRNTSQVQLPAPRAANNGDAAGVVPPNLAIEAKDALEVLRRAGAAAIALCMMNGDSIQTRMKVNQPKEPCSRAWLEFCQTEINGTRLEWKRPSLEGGMGELSLGLSVEFHRAFSLWRKRQLHIIGGGEVDFEAKNTLENIVEATDHLLQVQGEILADYYAGDCGAMHCGSVASSRLGHAYRDSWALENKMLNAIDGGHRVTEFDEAA